MSYLKTNNFVNPGKYAGKTIHYGVDMILFENERGSNNDWSYIVSYKDDSCLLYFSCQHSTNQIVVSRGEPTDKTIFKMAEGIAIIVCGILDAIVFLIIILSLRENEEF